MQRKLAFTDLSIKRFPPPERGSTYYWDTIQSGLGLRVGAGGARTFLVLLGSGKRQTIGRYPTVPLAKARSEAKQFLAEKTLGKLRPKRVAFDDAREDFLEDAAKRNRPRTVSDYTRLLKHFPFKRTALVDISKQDINRRLNLPPSEARHALVAAKIFFSWCVRQGYLERSPCEGLQAPRKAEARERVLSNNEIAEVYFKADSEPFPFGLIVRLLVLTGQRRGEIGALKWEYIDKDARTITLPPTLTKNRRQHTFPYGHAVADILEGIPEQSDFLFPASRDHVRGKPTSVFNGWPKAKAQLDAKLANVEPWTLHDLRRTFSSGLAALGIAQVVVEKLLNHVSGGTLSPIAQIYNRHSYMNEMRAAIAAWEVKLADSQKAKHPQRA